MAKQLVVSDLDDGLFRRLQERARSHGRTIEEETKEILSTAIRDEAMNRAYEEALKIRASLAGRQFSNSADLVREDRDR